MSDHKPWWKRWFSKEVEKPKLQEPAPGTFLINDDWQDQLEKYGLTGAHKWVQEQVSNQFSVDGQMHGRQGVPRQTIEAERIAVSRAHHILVTLRSWYQIKLAALKGKYKAASEARAIREEQFNEAERWRAEVERDFQDDTSKHSRFNAWLYLVFGLGLVVADIPFSWQLTAVGFGFHPEWKWDAEALFNVLLTGVVAFGIAAAAVFIKYFHDVVLAPHIRHSVSMLRTGHPHGIGDMTPRRWRKVEAVWSFRFLALNGLLVFVVCTLWQTGAYRYDTLVVKDRQEKLSAQNKKLQNDLRFYDDNNMEVPADLRAAVKTEGDLVREERQRQADLTPLEREQDERKRLIFILLTLMFPIMGGIMVSIAIRMLRARADRRQAKTLYGDSENFYGAKSAEVIRLEQEIEIFDKLLKEQFRLDEMVEKQMAATFLHSYNAGYNASIWTFINRTPETHVVVTTTRVIASTNGNHKDEKEPALDAVSA